MSFRFTSRQRDASQCLCCESLSSFSFDAFGCGRCIHSAACSLAWRKTRQGGIEFSKVSGKHRGTFKIHWLSIHWNERTQAKPGLFGWVQKLFVEFALGWFQLFRCEQTIRSYWRLHWLRGEQHQTWHHIIIKLMGRPWAFWDAANGVLDASWCDEKATESCCCQWPWSPNLTADFTHFQYFSMTNHDRRWYASLMEGSTIWSKYCRGFVSLLEPNKIQSSTRVSEGEREHGTGPLFELVSFFYFFLTCRSSCFYWADHIYGAKKFQLTHWSMNLWCPSSAVAPLLILIEIWEQTTQASERWSMAAG